MSGLTALPRSWVDGGVSLPAGRLIKFIIYSHAVTGREDWGWPCGGGGGVGTMCLGQSCRGWGHCVGVAL